MKMRVKAATFILILLAIFIVSVAVVVPLTSWITKPQAITEYAVEILMLISAAAGVAAMFIIACSRRGRYMG